MNAVERFIGDLILSTIVLVVGTLGLLFMTLIFPVVYIIGRLQESFRMDERC